MMLSNKKFIFMANENMQDHGSMQHTHLHYITIYSLVPRARTRARK